MGRSPPEPSSATAAGKFHITGSHAYAETNTAGYTVQVTIQQIGGGGTLTVNSLAKIADAPIDEVTNYTATGQSVNISFTNKNIAAFRDQDSLNTSPAKYAGTINWGDGTTSAASFALDHLTFNDGGYWMGTGEPHVHVEEDLHREDHDPRRRQPVEKLSP